MTTRSKGKSDQRIALIKTHKEQTPSRRSMDTAIQRKADSVPRYRFQAFHSPVSLAHVFQQNEDPYRNDRNATTNAPSRAFVKIDAPTNKVAV